MFIAATVTLEGKTKDSEIPSDKLNRFEFLEIIVRLANAKFVETKKIATIDEATAFFIKEHIRAHYTPAAWQSFRDKELWTMDVNDLIDAHQENL